MNYRETLDYLFSQLPMFSRIGAAAYKADLTNTIRLCEAIGNPQHQFKSIHIAGTNGKGSVSHMLASIMQASGHRTGLYTSPHLKDFRERIKTGDGSGRFLEINESFVISFTEKMKPLIAEIQPSFFEITVAMAFDYFAKERVEIAVIETGLGGRLDSTNIITPELSIITNIGWDHMNLLGDSLEAIAGEKAGIIKENVPVVVGEILPETKSVFINIAKEKNAALTIATEQRQIMEWNLAEHVLTVEVARVHSTDHFKYQLDLPGIYQANNLLTVLEACTILQQQGWVIDDKSIHKGLQQTKKITGLHGRWETIHLSPRVVLDVAHNADGMRQLARQVEMTTHREVHIVLGMAKDKEIDKVLELLPKQAEYYFTKAQIPRALPEDELKKQATALQLNGHSFPEVNMALAAALQHAHPDDLIIVCGSVFLAGEVDMTRVTV